MQENDAQLSTRPRVLKDAIFGAAVGDALGVPYEFLPRDSFCCTGMISGDELCADELWDNERCADEQRAEELSAGIENPHEKKPYVTEKHPAGTWSDDTSMLIATCDSIRAHGRVDVHDIRLSFESWYYRGAYTIDGVFGVGATTRRAIEEGYGQKGEYDNGNGSLMRIAPLAFCGATDDQVRDVSAITHAHRISYECCVDFVTLLRQAIADPATVLQKLQITAQGRQRKHVRSGGFVRDTMNAALWCVGTTSSYADCVLTAVNLGLDTDTTAAVAGALAGTIYGIEVIPSEWLDTLRGKELIEDCLF